MAHLSEYHRVHKFPNGATLIYYKHNVNNTTQFYTGFLGGSSVDNIPGTAHFLEHMLIKETKKYSQTYIAKEFKDSDLSYNAFTSNHYVMLYGDCPNSNLDKCLKLYSNLLFNRNFDEQSIDLERQAINEEINMSDDESGEEYSVFNDMITSITIPKSYNYDILGTKDDIAKINSKVLNDYIDSNFVGENMIITVVSNESFDEIKEKMEKYFVSKVKSCPEKKFRYEKTKYYDPSNYIFKTDDKNQHTVEIAVSYMSRKPERETHLYSYVENYIFNDFAGRLLKELRTKRGLVYTAQFLPYILQGNMALNSFYALTSKEKVNETIEVLGKIINKIAQEGITQEELDRCKNAILTHEIDRKNRTKTIKPMKLFYRYLEGTEIFFNNQIHKVKELTLDQVNKYLKDTYSNSNILVSINGDLPKDCYSTYDIQKQLGARLSQVYFDMYSQKYYNYSTGEPITKKEAMNILTGLSTREKMSNLCFVQDNTNIKLTPEMIKKAQDAQDILIKEEIAKLTNEQKIIMLKLLLESLNIDVQFEIEHKTKSSEQAPINEQNDTHKDEQINEEDVQTDDYAVTVGDDDESLEM